MSGRGTKIPTTIKQHKKVLLYRTIVRIYLFIYFATLYGMGILIPWLGVELVSLVLQVLSLNHWAAREILIVKI